MHSSSRVKKSTLLLTILLLIVVATSTQQFNHAFASEPQLKVKLKGEKSLAQYGKIAYEIEIKNPGMDTLFLHIAPRIAQALYSNATLGGSPCEMWQNRTKWEMHCGNAGNTQIEPGETIKLPLTFTVDKIVDHERLCSTSITTMINVFIGTSTNPVRSNTIKTTLPPCPALSTSIRFGSPRSAEASVKNVSKAEAENVNIRIESNGITITRIETDEGQCQEISENGSSTNMISCSIDSLKPKESMNMEIFYAGPPRCARLQISAVADGTRENASEKKLKCK